ncbi:signal recognition particle-docking protein FtsY [Changpingibacter yushuensis]|uniref:signal recognition particle-docking protein FtsY n=1 Tax=Changpingibacter yushuensis TaxID=2758440 RepID=UPI001FE3922A|nr:signal recognition particle-docking protein FtsY [Changpingibacter yushuensis]
MDTSLIIVISVVALLLAVGAIAGLIAASRRRSQMELPSSRTETIGTTEAPTSQAATSSAHEVAEAGITSEPEISAQPVELPESVPSRMQRLRARLARSGGLGQSILAILSRGDLSAADWEELEDTLLIADVGLESTGVIMERLKTRTKVEGTQDPARVRAILRDELLALVDPGMDRTLNLVRKEGTDGQVEPASVLVVGVNGTGKTTTVGKLARVLVAEGSTVLLGAADTFRAAAADQLTTWGERVGVDVVRSDREGADPASVAFEAIQEGREHGTDVVLVDTAGRLQNKAGLMDELGKIKRVMERQAPVNEVLLVLDATTGQNGMRQAQVFAEVTGITGIVLTKLDGTAKGGIVVAVQKELGVPVKFVGLGEGADDLAPFDPEGFVDALLG